MALFVHQTKSERPCGLQYSFKKCRCKWDVQEISRNMSNRQQMNAFVRPCFCERGLKTIIYYRTLFSSIPFDDEGISGETARVIRVCCVGAGSFCSYVRRRLVGHKIIVPKNIEKHQQVLMTVSCFADGTHLLGTAIFFSNEPRTEARGCKQRAPWPEWQEEQWRGLLWRLLSF